MMSNTYTNKRREAFLASQRKPAGSMWHIIDSSGRTVGARRSEKLSLDDAIRMCERLDGIAVLLNGEVVYDAA